MTELLLCGFELRRTWDRDVAVYHAQALGTWKNYTFLASGDPEETAIGNIYVADIKGGDLRAYWPWRHPHNGMGPVTGYSVTYTPRYGVQAWAFVGLEGEKGMKNVPVLLGEGKPDLSSRESFGLYGQSALKEMKEEFPLGRWSFIRFAREMNRHVMGEGYEPFEILSAADPSMDAPSGGELPASPAG
jgi:hypothetical protein